MHEKYCEVCGIRLSYLASQPTCVGCPMYEKGLDAGCALSDVGIAELQAIVKQQAEEIKALRERELATGCVDEYLDQVKIIADLRQQVADADLLLGNAWQDIVSQMRGTPSVEGMLRAQLAKLSADVAILAGSWKDLQDWIEDEQRKPASEVFQENPELAVARRLERILQDAARYRHVRNLFVLTKNPTYAKPLQLPEGEAVWHLPFAIPVKVNCTDRADISAAIDKAICREAGT